MKKIAFYCQHLMGFGHLSRCLAISQQLVEHFQIDFIQGGSDIGRSVEHRHFKHHFLPPLYLSEESGRLYGDGDNLDAILKERLDILEKISMQRFDSLIVELFPFGRRMLTSEITQLIHFVKEQNRDCKVICSVRDILDTKKDWDARQDRIIETIDNLFDAVLVHSDPAVVPFDLTFPKADRFGSKLFYTGYVVDPAPITLAPRQGIVVSRGGRQIGDRLSEVCLEVAKDFHDLKWYFIKSPNASLTFEKVTRSMGSDRIEIVDFVRHFTEFLTSKQLSISLGGYNTTMDILRTKTPAIIVPHPNSSEQKLRAKIFSDLNLIVKVDFESLNSATLENAIRKALDAPPAEIGLNLDGANNTTQWFRDFLY